jgi:hypothetical protein
MRTKQDQKPLDKRFFPRLWDLAHKAGLMAAEKAYVEPMVVSDGRKQYFVESGVCGFASVIVTPGTCSFAKWIKENKDCRKSYYGGIEYWVHLFGQSMTRKENYAYGFAKVLQEFGINARVTSRMD